MSLEVSNSACQHEWEEYDDPAAYNDGLNTTGVAICRHCGAQRDFRNQSNGANSSNWSKGLLAVLMLVIAIFLTPFFMLIALVMLLLTPETKADR